MPDFHDLRDECFRANQRLPELDLVIFTFGNVSVCDREAGLFAIKPSGVPYKKMSPKDIVILDFDARVVDGKLRPSSDHKTHAVLYKHWPAVGAISHTHSTYATAWAQALRDIPLMGTTHADHLTVDVPCAPPMPDDMIEGDYEHQTGFQILNEFEKRKLDYREVEMILLGNHAPFTWGKNAEKAVYNSAVLEEIAKMAFLSLSVNPSAGRMKKALIAKHYDRKHGKEAYYGQN
jgi:L-ribulose-5-phosphate 4-epimerase